jgi:hypothetical protein
MAMPDVVHHPELALVAGCLAGLIFVGLCALCAIWRRPSENLPTQGSAQHRSRAQ